MPDRIDLGGLVGSRRRSLLIRSRWSCCCSRCDGSRLPVRMGNPGGHPSRRSESARSKPSGGLPTSPPRESSLLVPAGKKLVKQLEVDNIAFLGHTMPPCRTYSYGSQTQNSLPSLAIRIFHFDPDTISPTSDLFPRSNRNRVRLAINNCHGLSHRTIIRICVFSV
jgi:hypothetical protein